MTVHLIAVQADMRTEHYRSSEAFGEKVLALAEAAVAGLDGAPKLVAFPEAIGFPLLLGLEHPPAASLSVAVLQIVRRSWRDLLGLGLRRGLVGHRALVHLRALPAFVAYRDAFAAAARLTGATVVAGTAFLPAVEEEASRGLHLAGRQVYNTAYTFGPSGTVLDRSRKVHLTPGAESRAGLSHGSLCELNAFETSIGRMGVAVCLDGFYASVIDRFDGQGARVVVQPSANYATWERPWPADPRLSEGQAWLGRGLRHQLQDRLHLRYGVNPMLVGDLWGMAARGRSSIVCNLRFREAACEGIPGVVALAGTADREEIVRARVEL